MLASVVTALALVASVAPIPLGEPGAISIPLHKRSSPFIRNGVVIGSSLARQAVRIQAKYANGNAAYKAKTGFDLFKGVEPLAKRQIESLIDEKDELWAGNITIGTPSQLFVIDFDTGSADLWVPASNCTNEGCLRHNKFDPSKSSTSSKQEGSFTIKYGDNTAVSGPIYSDSVTVGGLSVTRQYLSPITSESGLFASSPSDGIMGLAFSSISQLNASTFIENLYSQGKISAPIFSFRLTPSGSELYLGGANANKYTGDIAWVGLTSKTYWLTEGASNVGGVIGYNGSMIIDSGTSLIAGFSPSVKSWWSHVPGSQPCSIQVCGTTGFYTYPCSGAPNVSFTFSGHEFPISATDFNLGPADNVNKTTCVGAIMGMDKVPNNSWVLGDTFMKSVYTIFDEANSRIGFATPT